MFPNIIPTKGTITVSLNCIRCMNHTNTQVPSTAVAKEKRARSQRVAFGRNNNAIKIPNCAEEIVAPVVGDTNLFMHNCCIIKPATLIPTPVHSIANRRGSLEIRNISSGSVSPDKRAAGSTSRTPINKDTAEIRIRIIVKNIVV